MSRLDGTLTQYKNWQKQLSDQEVLLEVALEEADETVAGEIESGCKKLNEELEKFEFQRLLSGDYDDSAAIVTINAGAGGTDAQDWD